MTERPILFSGDMVNAILEGRKTQTRRVGKRYRTWRVGDRIWVRESLKKSQANVVTYVADGCPVMDGGESASWVWRNTTLPSMYMPKWASRITLEVVSVREEALQDITEEDAIAEGVEAAMLCKLLEPAAGKAKIEEPFWLDGAGESCLYCHSCAKKKLKRLRQSGNKDEIIIAGNGYSEEDGSRCCESCGVILDCTLNDYGVTSEMDHFQEYGIQSKEDAYTFLRVLGSEGNPLLTKTCGDFAYRPELTGPVAKIGFRWVWDSINGKKHPWKDNPAVWRIEFKRIEK